MLRLRLRKKRALDSAAYFWYHSNMKYTLEQVKEARERTGLSLQDIVAAFAQASKIDDVYDYLKSRGAQIAEAKRARQAGVRRVHTYVHCGKFASLCTFNCETDYAANTDEFKKFMHDICMHVAGMPLNTNPEVNEISARTFGNDPEWLKQPYILDTTITIADVISQMSAKIGEKVEVGVIERVVAF